MMAEANGSNALPQELPQIIEALEAIYNPRSSNEIRQSASVFLEQAKQSPQALAHGFSLASDASRDAVIRHFGLSMMAYHLKYTYNEGGGGESGSLLRDYVVHLAQNMREQDPPFLRNKVAQIWSEVAKRTWANEWTDMDELLVKLWEISVPHHDLVLSVLETLSDDIFNHEDYVAGLRGSELGSALSRILVPATVVAEQYSQQDAFSGLRFGSEGWLLRLCDYLKWCIGRMSQQEANVHSGILKTLSTMRSICGWISPKALYANPCVEQICHALAVGDTSIRTAAVETLCSIFGRINLDNDDVENLLSPMFSQRTIQLLREVLQWSDVNASDIDESKYTFLKKLSELIACLGTWAESKPIIIIQSGNLSPFFLLFLEVTRHPGLLVSAPLLHVWHRLLRSRSPEFSGIIQESMGPLLELCTQRCIRYDAFPEGSQEPTLLFLAEDCDTTPQRDALLNQNRQACVGIVELIVRRVPLDAIKHILGEVVVFLRNLSQNSDFNPQDYAKNSASALQADAQLTIIEAGSRGCLKWLSTVESNSEQNGSQSTMDELRNTFAQWCQSVLEIDVPDPDTKRKLIAQVVSITCKILPQQPSTAFSVLDTVLNVRTVQNSGATPQYTEAAKELMEICAYAAQKLASVFADHFLGIYERLEQKIEEIVSIEGPEFRPRYTAFLVMIVHRASNLDLDTKTDKLRRMIAPVKAAWDDPALTQAASDYSAFCSLVGWDRLPEFLSSHKFHQVQDWAAQPLDEESRTYQADLLNRNEQIPIRLTKALLHATTEKLEEGTPIFRVACTLWAEILPSILPTLLKMMSYALTFHNPERWSGFPDHLQFVIKRMLTDRFWQNGISAESRDAFVSKVSGSKFTYEGFGSTVRRTVRQIRVGCCDVLLLLTKLGDVFYGISDLPDPLAEALYEGAQALSPHHFSILLTISSQLINGCPVRLRRQFLPPILTKLFTQLDWKINSEWDTVNKRTHQASADDNLDDEMKNQSILRSMTYNGCYLLYTLMDQHRNVAETETSTEDTAGNYTLLALILTTPTVLEPILVFAKSAMHVHDTHSVSCIITTLRETISVFHAPGPVHDFTCDDLLKAAITSLHEPYFVDLQKDLASLIVRIITLDVEKSAAVIGSLPGLADQPDRVRAVLERVRTCVSERIGRAMVLELLEQIRGVSIHEMGRIGGPKKSKRRAALLEQYMAVDKAPVIERGGSPGLDGVANLLQ